MNLQNGLARIFGRSGGRIGPQRAYDLQQDGALLLDVRSPAEFQSAHAPHARNVPLDQLASRLRDVPTGRQIITICQSGGRSARAAALLRGENRDVVDVRGGMSAWQRAGLPVQRRRAGRAQAEARRPTAG
ncbi:MAG: rhodanese-like domain-containing protein [Actinomycetes bacterium]